MLYTWRNALTGFVIYAVGDGAAELILGEFTLLRVLGMALVGGTIYAIEIPAFFRWIDKVIPHQRKLMVSVKRSLMAAAYFNPLWIARHSLFIFLFSMNFAAIQWGMLIDACWSFLFSIPLSLLGNYIIQNKISVKWRFFGSSVFSAFMAVYYALSQVYLN